MGKKQQACSLQQAQTPRRTQKYDSGNFHDLEDRKDLPWLWVGGRHVSKYFRCEIERIFRTVFLPETILRCDLGKLLRCGPQCVDSACWDRPRLTVNSAGLCLLCWDVFMPMDERYAGCYTEKSSVMGYDHKVPCFTLDRFSDDQTRAFFKYGQGQIAKEVLYRRLHEKHLVGSPVFSIQIGKVVNDTGLPELQIDDDKEEISFEWRGMLDRLMGEEHVFNTILSQRLGWHLELEEKEADILETHRKLARRSRFQCECRAEFSTNILDHYTRDEKSALRNMQHLRLAASGPNHTPTNANDENVYTKQKIANELPNGTTIYSGNRDPGLKPGSIPRGIFTDQDYCMPEHRWGTLPPPSAADLFSPRPLPQLSWGRRPVYKSRKSKREQSPSGGKRAREEEEKELAMAAKKRRGAVSD